MRHQTRFDDKDEVDEADKEGVGVDRRLEDDKGGVMNYGGCKQRCGGDRNKGQLTSSGHC